ncbi:unnamed protein product [Allacma fusca]|uniref:Ionotropic receptor n=1 Tax=Allacma fusca TaxID=39272 RepID=A0A8J2LB10_9HEXA|nr:unnamed protein product [Allacma fusca]
MKFIWKKEVKGYANLIRRLTANSLRKCSIHQMRINLEQTPAAWYLLFLVINSSTKSGHRISGVSKATEVEALLRCSLKLIYYNTLDMQEFEIKNHFALFPKMQTLKMTLPFPKTSSFLNPHFDSPCEVVAVYLPKMEADLKSFQDFTHDSLQPKSNYFVFMKADIHRSYSPPYDAFLQKLRHTVKVKEFTEFLQNPNRILLSTREFLQNQHVRATVVMLDPFILLNNNVPIGGCYRNIIHETSLVYNFTYDLDYPEKFQGIVQLKNGTWIGQAGQVFRGDKDVLFGAAHSYARDKYFDFTSVIHVSGIKFITGQPRKTLNWAAVLYIFQPMTWLCLALLCLAVYSLFLSSVVLCKVKKENVSWAAILGMTINPLIEHGASVPERGTIRGIYIIWALLGVIIVTFFKRDLIAYFTYPKFQVKPKTFYELSHRMDYNIKLIQMDAAATTFFNTTTNPMYAGIRRRMTLERDWTKCIYPAAFDKNTVCITFDFVAISTVAKNLTLHRSFPTVQFSLDNAVDSIWTWAFTKNSKFVDSFSVVIRLVRDTGLFLKWIEDVYEYRKFDGIQWLKRNNGWVHQQVLNSLRGQFYLKVSAFKFKNVLVSFIILGGGLIISSLIFLFEYGLFIFKLNYI